jgi:hypothetical protein
LAPVSLNHRFDCAYSDDAASEAVGGFESFARGLFLNSYKERIFALMAFDYSYAFASYLDESFDMRSAGLFAVGGLIAQGPALFAHSIFSFLNFLGTPTINRNSAAAMLHVEYGPGNYVATINPHRLFRPSCEREAPKDVEF